MKKIVLFGLLVILVLSCTTGNQSQKGGTFVALSDLRFNPFYDPAIVKQQIESEASGWSAIFASSAIKAPGDYSADSSDPLLLSALGAVKGKAPGMPGWIIL